MKKIVVRIGFGLGNQLFEYASGLKMAEALHRPLFLDCGEFAIAQLLFIAAKDLRKYELAAFPIKGALIVGLKRILYILLWVLRKKWFALFNFVIRKRNMIWVDSNNLSVVNPLFTDYDRLSRFDTIYMSGIHCHVKLLPNKNTLLKNLAFPSLPLGQQRFANEIISAGSCSVSVHVRRGDYVKLHNSLPIAYYTNAKLQMDEKVRGAKYFVFSDDIAWCKLNFTGGGGVVFVDSRSDKAWVDMCLMSLCKHHIIANSTYSWWGAYLSKEAGVVLYPSHWWGSAPIHASMMPATWTSVGFEKSNT